MKLIDLLKVMDKDTFIFLSVSVCGMRFETKHSAEFYIEHGDELNNKKILKVYVEDGYLHVALEG